MIETCVLQGCFSGRAPNSVFCAAHHAEQHPTKETKSLADRTRELIKDIPKPPLPEAASRHGRRHTDQKEGEYSGGNVDYYRVKIEDPKRNDQEPYMAECEDIIEALQMTFAQGCAFKAIWRDAAMRNLGHKKRGADEHGLYDAQKVEYYGNRMKAQAERRIKQAKTTLDPNVK